MTKRALLIGINYKGTKSALRGCINDVQNMKKVLMEKFGYEEKNIRVLTDEERIKPTKRNMELCIQLITHQTRPGDTVYFHYSGHGYKIRDTSGDESDGYDEVLIPLDHQRAGVITDDWLRDNLAAAIPKDSKLFCVLDCCHSGTGMDLPFTYRYNSMGKPTPIPNEYNPKDWREEFILSKEKEVSQRPIRAQVCAFSGCEDPQTSADAYIQGSFQGAFTSCFIDVIEHSENIRERSLMDILKEVNCRLIVYRMTQRSQLSVMNAGECETKFFL